MQKTQNNNTRKFIPWGVEGVNTFSSGNKQFIQRGTDILITHDSGSGLPDSKNIGDQYRILNNLVEDSGSNTDRFDTIIIINPATLFEKSTGRALLETATGWEGRDFNACLKNVYDLRAEVKF